MTPLAAIHVAKKQLGLDDDTYRAVLVRATGKPSAGDMTPAEHDRALAELRRLGFKSIQGGGTSSRARKGLQGRFAKKLQALWIAGYNLGIVRDRRDEALLAFVKRQTGIDHVRFLRDTADARKAVEALKAWLAREGGVVWGTSNGYDFLQHDPGKIAWAQWRKIVPGATLMGNKAGFYQAVMEHVAGAYSGKPLGSVTPAEWRAVMNALGAKIRKAKP